MGIDWTKTGSVRRLHRHRTQCIDLARRIAAAHAQEGQTATLEAGDTQGLLALISEERSLAAVEADVEVELVSCFEAGRDGFWLHRFLLAHGVKNHAVEPTSILVTRAARRAKTDRLDAQGLLRVLAAGRCHVNSGMAASGVGVRA